MKRPTPKPLTGTERAELDKLIRRATGAINSVEGSRLVRLLDLDQADRAQERRTADGTERTNRELTQRLKDTEARLATLHEGEEPYVHELTMVSPAQWIWLWNRATPAERLARVDKVLDDQGTARTCRFSHGQTWDAMLHHREQQQKAEARITLVQNVVMNQTSETSLTQAVLDALNTRP